MNLMRLGSAIVHPLALLCDRFGFHLLPKHYYSPVSDFSWLRRNRHIWTSRTNLSEIGWDLDAQMGWLSEVCDPYYAEVEGLKNYNEVIQSGRGLGYGPIESQVLHCFVRTYRPRQVVEIGSGISTDCIRQAAELNRCDGAVHSEITCIDPYAESQGFLASDVKHHQAMLQEVPPSIFGAMRSGDLLFVDSSHTVRVGSEVLRIYLEIIPRLAHGVYIHIHDINLPYLYPRDALHKFFGWQETALLVALLLGNPRLRVVCCMSALHYDRPRELAEVLGDYVPQRNDEGLQTTRSPRGHFPSSIWLRSV